MHCAACCSFIEIFFNFLCCRTVIENEIAYLLNRRKLGKIIRCVSLRIKGFVKPASVIVAVFGKVVVTAYHNHFAVFKICRIVSYRLCKRTRRNKRCALFNRRLAYIFINVCPVGIFFCFFVVCDINAERSFKILCRNKNLAVLVVVFHFFD